MEFRDLKRQYNALREEITKRTERILEESRFINGREVGELEGKLAEYVGVKHCITCGNGTDALRLDGAGGCMLYEVVLGAQRGPFRRRAGDSG